MCCHGAGKLLTADGSVWLAEKTFWVRVGWQGSVGVSCVRSSRELPRVNDEQSGPDPFEIAWGARRPTEILVDCSFGSFSFIGACRSVPFCGPRSTWTVARLLRSTFFVCAIVM
eukprot:350966-Pleurochrysis_carterae.AAC.1